MPSCGNNVFTSYLWGRGEGSLRSNAGHPNVGLKVTAESVVPNQLKGLLYSSMINVGKWAYDIMLPLKKKICWSHIQQDQCQRNKSALDNDYSENE